MIPRSLVFASIVSVVLSGCVSDVQDDEVVADGPVERITYDFSTFDEVPRLAIGVSLSAESSGSCVQQVHFEGRSAGSDHGLSAYHAERFTQNDTVFASHLLVYDTAPAISTVGVSTTSKGVNQLSGWSAGDRGEPSYANLTVGEELHMLFVGFGMAASGDMPAVTFLLECDANITSWVGATVEEIEPITPLNSGMGASLWVPGLMNDRTWAEGSKDFRSKGERVYSFGVFNPFKDQASGNFSLTTPDGDESITIVRDEPKHLGKISSSGDFRMMFDVTAEDTGQFPFGGAVAGLGRIMPGDLYTMTGTPMPVDE